MHNHHPQTSPCHSRSSTYYRVNANENDADKYDQRQNGTVDHHSHDVHLDISNSGRNDDPLQQSLLRVASTAHQEQVPPGSTWEAPPRLHCGLQYLLDLWMIIFPYVRRMGNLLFGITILTMLFVVPMVTYSAIEEHRFDFAAFDSAGVMVLGTLVLSFRLVYLHLTHWYMPQVQKYVVRIVWMVPLYAVQSWLSLRFRDARIYINAIRDLYEAFVIASFLYYLIELLGGQEALVQILLSKAERRPDLGKHPWPLNYVLHDWQLGMEFMLQCKHGVLQYVVVKTAATVLTYFFEIVGCYGEGQFQWNTSYPYLAFLLNTSVMYALYVLVMLFHAVRDELKHPVNWRPLGKFLCVKGVVFFTWWQGVVIFYLKSKDFIKDTGSWSGEEIANALIDYCICFEMVFFAVAHSYTFTYKEYLPSSIPPQLRNLAVNANINANANVAGSSSPHPLRLEPQRSSISTTTAASAANGGDQSTMLKFGNGNAAYRAPAVLDQPMNFKEAFWSSSIPKETIEDIQKLRSGVKNSIVRDGNSTSKGSISLSDIQSEETQIAATTTTSDDADEGNAAARIPVSETETQDETASTDNKQDRERSR